MTRSEEARADAAAFARGNALGPLVEREVELATLDGLLADVASGWGRALIIGGAAGIGKTSLVGALSTRAKQAGFTTLNARASEFERDYPFGCVRQFFETILERDPERRAKLLDGDAGPAAAVFGTPTRSGGEGASAGFDMLHGLHWLTANLAADGPLMLTLDDAHWGDLDSIRYLSFLARRLEGLPVLVALTIRSGEPQTDAGALRELGKDSSTTVIELAPLSEHAVTRIVGARLNSEVPGRLGADCHRATGGNPLLLEGLLHALKARGLNDLSSGHIETLDLAQIADNTTDRIDRIGNPAAEVTQAVAVLGDGAELRSVAQLEGLAPDLALRTADELAAAGILEVGRPLSFVHPIVRAAVYERIAPAERHRLHSLAATQLRQRGGSAEAVSLHLLATEPNGNSEVVELLRSAADSAAARGAPDASVRYLERALNEDPVHSARGEILLSLGQCAGLAAHPRAAEWLGAALKLQMSPRSTAEAALGLLFALLWSAGPLDDVLELIGRLRAEGNLDAELDRQLDSTVLALGHLSPATRTPVAQLVRENLAAARTKDLSAELLANAVIECALADGTAEETVALAKRAMALGGGVEHGDEIGPPFIMAALIVCERFDLAERLADDLLRAARGHGAHVNFASTIAMRAWGRYRQGRLAEVRADAGLYQGFAQSMLADWQLAGAHVQALVDAGLIDQAAAIVAPILAVPAPPGLTIYQRFAEALAPLRMAQGDALGALEATRGIAAWEEGIEQRNGNWVAWRTQAALAQFALGEPEEARRLAVDQVDLARRFGAAGMLGSALRGLGVVAVGDESIDVLREGVELLAGSALRLEHARAEVDLGTVLQVQGCTTEAAQSLRSGHDRALLLGATAVADRAVFELVKAGLRPRPAPSGRLLDSLTPSERRVAEHVASGMSNKDVAQELFVTVNTVETHLRHTYRKLQITSRAQLASRLSEREA